MVLVTLSSALRPGAGRRMDSRHLARGAMMFPDPRWLGKVAVRMHGDMPEHLLAAIQNTKLVPVCEAAAPSAGLATSGSRSEHRLRI